MTRDVDICFAYNVRAREFVAYARRSCLACTSTQTHSEYMLLNYDYEDDWGSMREYVDEIAKYKLAFKIFNLL